MRVIDIMFWDTKVKGQGYIGRLNFRDCNAVLLARSRRGDVDNCFQGAATPLRFDSIDWTPSRDIVDAPLVGEVGYSETELELYNKTHALVFRSV